MRIRSIVAVVLATACAGSGAVVTATVAGAATTAAVTVAVSTSTWYGGGTTTVALTNETTATIRGWVVTLAWPSKPSSVWNGRLTSYKSGVLAVANASWNSTVAPGAQTSYGFTSTFSGAPPAPSSCTVTSGRLTLACAIASTGPTSSPSPTTSTTPTASPTASASPTATASPTPTATATASPTSSPSTTATPPPTPTASPAAGRPYVAPYVDMAAWPVPQLTTLQSASGITRFSLGFITAASGCVPAWGGYGALGVTATGSQIGSIDSSIAAAQSAGDQVVLSFGGASGTELAQACATVATLEDAYRTAITTYGVTRVDFDIEGAAQTDHAANSRRAQAIAALQQEMSAAGHPLAVQLTLPVLPTGLTSAGLGVLSDSIAGGMAISVVNVLAMDYGGAVVDMGQAAIDAATSLGPQLAAAYPSLTPGQRQAMVGITPMIGMNDISGEVFGLADAQRVYQWSLANGIGFLAYWDVQRDGPCPSYAATLSDTCSGTSNLSWAYAQAFGV